MEQACQIHGYCRIHRLENGSTTTCCGRTKLAELIKSHHRGFSYRIVSIDNSYLMLINIVLLQMRCSQCIAGSHIGILCLFRHELTEITIYKWL